MMDAHDTDLPEKPVELEEEKKTAEVSETATTGTPAEEAVSVKPVESDRKLTKEGILAKLKEMAADAGSAAKPEIDGLKQAFYRLHNAGKMQPENCLSKTEGLPKILFRRQTAWKKNSSISCPSSKKREVPLWPSRRSRKR